jgi:hypothetical protein
MLRGRRGRRGGYARIGFLLLGYIAVKAEIAQQRIGGVEEAGNGQNGADYEFVFHHASPAFGHMGGPINRICRTMQSLYHRSIDGKSVKSIVFL